MTVTAGTPIELVEGVYATLPERVAAGRERFGRPLTLTEKILLNHLYAPTEAIERGEADVAQAVLRRHMSRTFGLIDGIRSQHPSYFR